MGSNLGKPEKNLMHALARLEEVPGLFVAAYSTVYLTEPQEMRDQPWFANQVACVLCEPGIEPLDLLETCLGIESDMGRIREDIPKGRADKRFGPRIIDLDLLLFGNLQIKEPGLILPHPRMRSRAFVLLPLLEIAPELVFPDGEPLAEALSRLLFTCSNN
ncbi:MAG: 2-amino-4-hydroxy-6-hydroxymethyldihydropteridine diphosphokinase, partial [Thermodesulfobacteriota bacterium]|nr:2-amino-4-hydroxy-6-hydroxymethyldihydropteridine diphosphokinase [Thermodesulfobacteriota bacterium]